MRAGTLFFRIASLILTLASGSLSAARIAVSDFRVQSANPEYRFLGKGFAEFISIELSRSDRIQLIEREQRLEAIREIEISQTGLIDEKAQIEAGKLLTAEYIILGNIYDINNQLSITVRVVETASTRVVWQDKITGRLAQYDALSAQITAKILGALNMAVPAAVAAKQNTGVDRVEAAALKFSTAVDAVDRKDTNEARKHLTEAKQLDPANEAIEIYLRKLVVNTAKFRTISQEYFPNTNPAALGLMRSDRFFLTSAIVNFQETTTHLGGTDREIIEQDLRLNAGYQAPLGKRWGIGVEGILFHYKDEVHGPPANSMSGTPPPGVPTNTFILTNPDNFGAIGSLSFAPSENISFGVGVAFYQQVKRQQYSGYAGAATDIIRENQLGLSLGAIIKNTGGTVVFDTLFGYSTQSTYLLNATAMTIGNSFAAPLYNENTIAFGLLGKRIFLALKEINEYWKDRSYYSARILPVLEIWLFAGFALRAGAAHNYANLDGLIFNRTGWIAGLSLRSISTGWDFDLNVTNHNRPSRIVIGQIINETIVYFTLSKSNNFVSR